MKKIRMNSILNKNRYKGKNLLLEEEMYYNKLKETKEIEDIIVNMPRDLADIEKAYYVYMELGKLISQDPNYFSPKNHIEQRKAYYKPITKNKYGYFGICKSIDRLYQSILKDERIGVDCETSIETPEIDMSHVETILKINGKVYITNLVQDLSRIQTSESPKEFGINVSRDIKDYDYKTRLLFKYNKNLDYIDQDSIDKMNRKLGYYSYIKDIEKEKEIYTSDVVDKIFEEINNPEYSKIYIFKGKDVPENERYLYIVDYILTNANKFTEFTKKNINPIELFRYYNSIFKKVLTLKELDNIKHKFVTINDNKYNLISVFQVKRNKNGCRDNLYYILERGNKKYERKTKREKAKTIKEYKNKLRDEKRDKQWNEQGNEK